MVVQALMAEHGMSERPACQASPLHAALPARCTRRLQGHHLHPGPHGTEPAPRLWAAVRQRPPPRRALGQDGALARVLRAEAEPAQARQEAAAIGVGSANRPKPRALSSSSRITNGLASRTQDSNPHALSTAIAPRRSTVGKKFDCIARRGRAARLPSSPRRHPRLRTSRRRSPTVTE